MLSLVCCRNFSAFDWATVSLEYQSGQTYWRSGPGCITVQKQTLRWAGERTKIRILRHFSGPRPHPQCGGRHPLALSTYYPYNLGACGASILASSALDLAPSKPKSWIRPWGLIDRLEGWRCKTDGDWKFSRGIQLADQYAASNCKLLLVRISL